MPEVSAELNERKQLSETFLRRAFSGSLESGRHSSRKAKAKPALVWAKSGFPPALKALKHTPHDANASLSHRATTPWLFPAIPSVPDAAPPHPHHCPGKVQTVLFQHPCFTPKPRHRRGEDAASCCSGSRVPGLVFRVSISNIKKRKEKRQQKKKRRLLKGSTDVAFDSAPQHPGKKTSCGKRRDQLPGPQKPCQKPLLATLCPAHIHLPGKNLRLERNFSTCERLLTTGRRVWRQAGKGTVGEERASRQGATLKDPEWPERLGSGRYSERRRGLGIPRTDVEVDREDQEASCRPR